MNIKLLKNVSETREILYFRLRYTWGFSHMYDLYYVVRNFFKPRQAWYVKDMYYDWCDKPELIQQSLYNAIVNYVEEEKCFESIDWNDGETHQECEAFITDCYDWIKIRRPKITDKIEQIINQPWDTSKGIKHGELNLNKFINSHKTYDELYPGLANLEKELEDKDTEYLCKIVKFRNYLWT